MSVSRRKSLLAATTLAPAPTATEQPSITGTLEVGETLTASPGAWSGAPTGFYYQWRRCDGSLSSCATISSAAGPDKTSYTTTSADSGSQLVVWIRASNAAGHS